MKAILTGHQPKEIVDNPTPPNVAPAYMPNEVSWHIGIPTEEGDYLLTLRFENLKLDVAHFKNGRFMSYHGYYHNPEYIIKWEKIEERE